MATSYWQPADSGQQSLSTQTIDLSNYAVLSTQQPAADSRQTAVNSRIDVRPSNYIVVAKVLVDRKIQKKMLF